MATLVPVKGIKKYTSKGTVYYYHRKTGTRIQAPPGTAAFINEVEALDAKVTKAKAKPGTLAGVIARYKDSDFWKDLAPATKVSYERALAHLKKIEGMPLKKIDQEFVASVRDKISKRHKRWMANYVMTVLSILFDTALENGWANSNPVDGVRRIKKDKGRPKVNRIWPPQECRTVLDAAPPYLRVPIALAMFTGLRKADVLSIEKTSIRDGMVYHKTSKTGAEAEIPVEPSLANVLAIAPPHCAKTLCATSRGEPWTESGFNSTFCKLINRLEAAGAVNPGLTMHGLRHTLATRLSETGADDRTIQNVLCQKTRRMAHLYSETADRSEQTLEAFGNLHILEPRPRTKPSRRVSNSVSNDKEGTS